ncbi:ParB/RepB/Spo0J family partition protein, partial [Ruminococcaceae bacterium OttesenSCG-928-O06]|nr:ParB/RepB/Spo0J family partition protein [Ruminococcaceae bacterium OttesenSCG-928-O06]
MNREIKLSLPGVDDLFSTQETRDDAKLERIKDIPLEELHPFQNHPFKVRQDAELEKLTESIRAIGAINPALARPHQDGGYELISGHRRLAACQALGLETMPVVIRELTDDEAVIAMVDANMQRETILPSEKAYAYKMKLEALSHQGATCGQVGHKSRDAISDDESGRQVQRFIRLTNLIPELLELVDSGKIAFNPAVELSYLPQPQQQELFGAIEREAGTPSHAQAIRLKKLSQEGTLDAGRIQEV